MKVKLENWIEVTWSKLDGVIHNLAKSKIEILIRKYIVNKWLQGM